MNRRSRQPLLFSKISLKGQTVIPREVRQRLQINPGDTLRDRLTDNGVLIDKAMSRDAGDPFATFTEWANEADEKAYRSL